MNSFTEGLDLELRTIGSPVKLQALCPGFTLSEFHDVAKVDRKTIPGWRWMRAEDVVDESMVGLARGQLVVVPGGIYKLLAMVMRWIRNGCIAPERGGTQAPQNGTGLKAYSCRPRKPGADMTHRHLPDRCPSTSALDAENFIHRQFRVSLRERQAGYLTSSPVVS